MTATRGWDRWSGAGAERPWTVGIEEELMLLDPARWSVANRVDDVLAVVSSDLAARVSAETHACVAELKTAPCDTVDAAAAELAGLRRSLAEAVDEQLGLRMAAAGTHPLATRSEVSLSSGPRYREVGASMRALARREPTMALHVHVAVPDGATAVRALDGLRDEIPLLLALSANSPYWRAADSGFASIRTPIFSMFPRVGIPPHSRTYEAYVRLVETMLRAGAIPEPGFLWWDARLQPTLGTVEVRVMDAQSRVCDAAALAAVVQCFVRRCADGCGQRAGVPAEVLAENRFLAARDGMEAVFVDASGRRTPAAASLARLLERCHPAAEALGCVAELAAAQALADDPGHDRQRRIATQDGLSAVPARLSDEFAIADRSSLVA